MKKIVIALVFLMLILSTAWAKTYDNGYPVVLDGVKIYYIKEGTGLLKAEQRAIDISDRLEKIAKDKTFELDDIRVKTKGLISYIYINNELITVVTSADEKALGINKELYAKEVSNKIKSAIIKYRERRTPQNYVLGIVYTILTTIGFVVALNLLWKYTAKIFKIFEIGRQRLSEALHLKRFNLLPAKLFISIINVVLNVIRIGLFLLLFYFFVVSVLGYFPGTVKYEVKLVEQFQKILFNFGVSIIDYIPHLLFIVIVVMTTYYVNQIIKHIFAEIKSKDIVIEGFYCEWARPTDKILRFLIIAIAFASIFPHLPGASSGAFQGVSVFLGVLVSLGSTAIVANIVAGVLLIYSRAFKVNDIVKVADTIGSVVESTLIVTRLKTIKNVVISIPNSVILASHIVNYSSALSEKGLIVHTEVTIGYDVPWREVYRLMLEAAEATNNILKEPKPFILQTALGDYSVKYELNAYTAAPQLIPITLSEIHQNIIDKFNEANIEITSPQYTAVRDGNLTTVPESYRPQDYKPSGWIIK